MLTIYRRHKKNCEHRREGRKYRRCRCPIWVDGFLSGGEIRKSLGTSDWQRAHDIVRQWEADGNLTSNTEPVTIEQAWEKYLVDARDGRKLAESTIYKYELLSRQMKAFANERGYRFVFELTVDVLSDFRSTWKDGALAGSKKLEWLRTFMRFAVLRGWIATNPASDLKPPKVQPRPTLPFTHEEMVKILAAIEAYTAGIARNGKVNAQRMRTLVLLLRYSGMRIGDAVSLSTEKINGNRLFLYTAKTGTPVSTVLPDFLVKTLEDTPRTAEQHYFWTGTGRLSTAVRMWEARLKRIFERAKLPTGRAHRFRDSFAVELLLAGVPMERVSILLGHTSIRVTERHYAPWVKARQDQLEADVSRVWKSDPLAVFESQLQMKGTREVHQANETVN